MVKIIIFLNTWIEFLANNVASRYDINENKVSRMDFTTRFLTIVCPKRNGDIKFYVSQFVELTGWLDFPQSPQGGHASHYDGRKGAARINCSGIIHMPINVDIRQITEKVRIRRSVRFFFILRRAFTICTS